MSVEGGPCVPRLLQWWRGQADRQEIRLYKARYQNINILQASFFFGYRILVKIYKSKLSEQSDTK